jgi:Fe-coproporphyrin III synthase
MLARLPYYARFAFEFCLLRRDVPLLLGLVITDRCNLACRHCRVSNTGRRDMTYDEIVAKLSEFHARGFRELYLEGGEPFVWRDGERCLDDIVEAARRIGFFHVHIFSNGTFPLASRADMLWVGFDGLPAAHEALRGSRLDQVITNLRASAHRRIALVCTVNSLNRDHLRELLCYVRDERLPVRGVMFYFHTPYYGKDELFLEAPARNEAIAELLRSKRRGLPVLNSYAALEAVRRGRWKRRFASVWVSDVSGDHLCCRDNSGALCEDCGYAAYAELTEIQRLSPSAIWSLLNYR